MEPETPAPEEDGPDRYASGLTNSTVTIAGTWEPNAYTVLDEMLGSVSRRMTWCASSRRLFGIDWWRERYAFDVTDMAFYPDTAEARFGAASQCEVEYAEWWRRAGWRVLHWLGLA